MREDRGQLPSPQLTERSARATHLAREKGTVVQRQKIARRKPSLLQLDQELDSVSKAWHIVGSSRQWSNEIGCSDRPILQLERCLALKQA